MKLSILDKIKLYRLSQNKTMLAKLQSRKLWATVIGAALAALGSQLGLDESLVTKLVEMIMVYVAAQAAVDATQNVRTPK